MTCVNSLGRLSIPVFDFSIAGGSSRLVPAYRKAVGDSQGALLGFDLGLRHVGLALSDER